MEYKVTYIQTPFSTTSSFRGDGKVEVGEEEVTFSGRVINHYTLAVIFIVYLPFFIVPDDYMESLFHILDDTLYGKIILLQLLLVLLVWPLVMLYLSMGSNFFFRIPGQRTVQSLNIGNVSRHGRTLTCSTRYPGSCDVIDITFRLGSIEETERMEEELLRISGGRNFTTPNVDAQHLVHAKELRERSEDYSLQGSA